MVCGSLLHRFVVLDDTDDVALRVSKPTNGDLGVSDVRRRHDHGRAQLLGPLKICLWIVNLDVDHDRWADGCVSGTHSAADAGITITSPQ